MNFSLESLLKKGFKNKEKKLSKKSKNKAKISFRQEYWVIHTLNKDLQKSLSDYLHNQSWDGQMENIFHNGKPLTCFPIPTIEILEWIRKNCNMYINEYKILHKTKKYYSAYRKLKADTEVI